MAGAEQEAASRALAGSAASFSWLVRLRLAHPALTCLPAAAFLFVAAPLCLFLAMVVPVGQGPDEDAHIVRAASLLRGEVVGRRESVPLAGGNSQIMAGVEADPALARAADALPPGALTKLDAATLKAAQDQPWAGPRFVPAPNTAAYLPAFYVPPAIGLAVARAGGASPYQAIRAARLANAAAFLILGLAALLLARRGAWLLFCALTLPMTLFLASVVNQDGPLIAVSALAAALLSRGPEPKPGAARRWEHACAAFLIGCIVAAKPPYLPLTAMLLLPLPPPRAWMGVRRALLRRLGLVVLVAAPALAWLWMVQRWVATPLPSITAAYAPGPLWPGDHARLFDSPDPMAQLAVLRAAPSRFLSLPWRTLVHDPWITYQAIGTLGWLTVLLPRSTYLAWYAALGAALLAGLVEPDRGRLRARWSEAALLLAAAVASVLLIYLAQYVSWTAVGAKRIDGFQGRYLLPLIPVVALALPQLAGGRGAAVHGALSLLPLAAALCQMAVLPMVVVEAWYLR